MTFPNTDERNAEWMVREHGENLRYCHDSRKWHIWDGKRWAVDETAEVQRLAVRTVRGMTEKAAKIEDDDKRKIALKWVLQSENDYRLKSMVARAQAQREVSVTSRQFDSDPWLLNVQNGTIDLKTGKLRPHRRSDMLTKICPVDYLPDARCPKFEAFLDEIFSDQPKTIGFIQRCVGYTLTGDTSEQCFFLPIGVGKNGKGVVLQTIENLMGDYGEVTKFDIFIARPNSSSGPRDGVAKLAGARFVRASESDEGQRFAEAKIKELTAPDGKLSACFLYREDFKFTPQFKLWLATNHEPRIRGTDEAIWRRIHRINFNYIVPSEKRDPHLAENLWKEESSGILNWALEGLRQWRDGGLRVPETVRRASEEYRNSQNVVKRFLEDCIRTDSKSAVEAGPLYSAYRQWAKSKDESVFTQSKFGTEFGKLARRERAERGCKYVGIRLAETTEEVFAVPTQ